MESWKAAIGKEQEEKWLCNLGMENEHCGALARTVWSRNSQWETTECPLITIQVNFGSRGIPAWVYMPGWGALVAVIPQGLRVLHS